MGDPSPGPRPNKAWLTAAVAASLVGGWLVGTAAGAALAVHGFVKRSRSIMPGAVIAILVNLGTLLVCAKVVHAVREADFSLKSTERYGM